MLSLAVAQELKAAGLPWTPTAHDFFGIPNRGMDERLFVISDVMTYIETIRGQPAVTFHGAVEWALDYVMLSEVIWIPREEQLREMVEVWLRAEAPPALTLTSTRDGYRCEIRQWGETVPFEAFGAGEAYARALIYLLRQEGG